MLFLVMARYRLARLEKVKSDFYFLWPYEHGISLLAPDRATRC